MMFGLDHREGGDGTRQVEVVEVGPPQPGEVLTILTHSSPQIGAAPSGGWVERGRNEKRVIHLDNMWRQTGVLDVKRFIFKKMIHIDFPVSGSSKGLLARKRE